MKKLIPVFTAIVLIILIVAVSAGVKLAEKYSYSKERADLKEYFGIEKEDEVAIVLQDERVEEKAKLIGGVYYFDMATVQKYFNDRFYEDRNEQLLLYTLPDDTVRVEIGASSYTTADGAVDMGVPIALYGAGPDGSSEVLYLAADYVKLFADYTYEAFAEPNRMQVYTEKPQDRQEGRITKKTAVRYQGGVKSPILADLAEGDTVIILEEMETWSKVKTADALIGYVENKRLETESAGMAVEDLQPQIQGTDDTGFRNPEFTSLTRPYKINLGWHVVAGTGGNDTLVSALQNTEGINVVSPTWFALTDSEGNFSSFATSDYVTRAHDMGLEVWGLIDNFSNRDAVDTYELLSHTSRRAYLIRNLVDTALGYGLDGINVDFESISQDAGTHFVQFIRELSVECRKSGLVLSVDNYVPTGDTDHYNRKEQGVFADYVIIMGYDEHYSGSREAGSVASIGFVEEGIRRTVEQVPAHKVINALPFYTRIWKSEGADLTSEAVGMEMAEQFVANHNMEVRWDEAACQNYAEASEGSAFYQVWLEDEQSIEAKLNIMQKYEIGGVAAWRLGFEKASIWGIIRGYLEK